MRFVRQKVLGHYIADFYCAKAKMAIELDGSQHYDPQEMKKDQARTNYLSGYDIMVLRIPNNEVMKNFSGVCEYIDQLVHKRVAGNDPSVG